MNSLSISIALSLLHFHFLILCIRYQLSEKLPKLLSFQKINEASEEYN